MNFAFIVFGGILLVMAVVGLLTGKIYVGSKKDFSTKERDGSTVSKDENPNSYFTMLVIYGVGGVVLLTMGLTS